MKTFTRRINNRGDMRNARSTNPPVAFSSLSPEHAFVVQAAMDASGAEIQGRVVHVVSGQASGFQGEVAAFDFIRGVLASLGMARTAP